MSIDQSVKSICDNLSEKWFQKVRREFKEHIDYQAKTDVIELWIPSYQVYDPIADDVLFYDGYPVHCTLIEYCWKGFEPMGMPLDESLEKKGINYYDDILSFTNKLISTTSQVFEKQKLNVCVVASVDKHLLALQDSSNDFAYRDVLEHISNLIRSSIAREFRILTAAHDALQTGDKLEFNLNRKQLASLLAILKAAKIFRGSEEKYRSFNAFCDKYFYFKNQASQNEFSRAIKIKTDIQEASRENNHDYQAAINDVKSMLSKAFREF